MPFQDFRQFLDVLRQHGELIDINRPVALNDVGKAMKQAYVRTGPAILFNNNVTDYPLVAGIYSTRAKALLAFEELLSKYPDSKHAETASLNRAQVLYLAGHKPEALKAAKEFLAKYPTSAETPTAQSFLALAQRAQTQQKEAAAHLTDLPAGAPDPARGSHSCDQEMFLLEGDLTLAPGKFETAAESVVLPESGLAVFRDDSKARAVVDVGELGFGRLAAHGHPDALSLLLDAVLWRPLRKRRAGFMSLFLASIGLALVLRQSLLFAYGPVLLHEALNAAETLGTRVQVVNMPWLNRIDSEWLTELVEPFGEIFVVEDHAPVGALGDSLRRHLDGRPVTVFGVEGWPACGTPLEAPRFPGLGGASPADRIALAVGGRTAP